MDIYPEDFWMTFDTSWAPQPGWLGTDDAGPAHPIPTAVQALASGRGKGDATRGMDVERAAAVASRGAGKGPVVPGSRKKKPAACASTTRPVSAQRREKSGPGKALRYRLVPARGTEVSPKPGRRGGTTGLENVVVLRPRTRDYTYADYVLSALRSMFEAQAAGEKDLLIARVKLVSHLLEDIGRRRRD
jgi:hypothetical protein